MTQRAFIMAGGGTGGHVIPGIAVARELAAASHTLPLPLRALPRHPLPPLPHFVRAFACRTKFDAPPPKMVRRVPRGAARPSHAHTRLVSQRATRR